MDKKIADELKKLKNLKKAEILSRFFKTGKGEYGEGDKFLGLTVPQQRLVSKKYPDASLDDLQKLLSNTIHEYRLTALLILIIKFKKAYAEEKEKIFNFYLKNTKYINNWDLVDLSAPNIIGKYLLLDSRFRGNDSTCLYKLAKSKSLWEKRIAIISTYEFIRNNHFKDTLKISEMLLNDKHDLIRKAVGWMLREIGKRNQKIEEAFLKKYYLKMPRMMLRYAIERFDENKRKFYLNRV